MGTELLIIGLFCRVDDQIGHLEMEYGAYLHPSEIVTLGMLFALKGQGNRQFYRWLARLAALVPRAAGTYPPFSPVQQVSRSYGSVPGVHGPLRRRRYFRN